MAVLCECLGRDLKTRDIKGDFWRVPDDGLVVVPGDVRPFGRDDGAYFIGIVIEYVHYGRCGPDKGGVWFVPERVSLHGAVQQFFNLNLVVLCK